jgi:hypothetical protein
LAAAAASPQIKKTATKFIATGIKPHDEFNKLMLKS